MKSTLKLMFAVQGVMKQLGHVVRRIIQCGMAEKGSAGPYFGTMTTTLVPEDLDLRRQALLLYFQGQRCMRWETNRYREKPPAPATLWRFFNEQT